MSFLDKIVSEVKDNKGKWAMVSIKICAGLAAVHSIYSLDTMLNAMGCRYAVETSIPALSLALTAYPRKVLNHKYFGRFLDTVYLLVIGYIIFASFTGMQDLQAGGCENYYAENVDSVEIDKVDSFMNKTEYSNFQKKKASDAPKLNYSPNSKIKYGRINFS